MHKKTKEIVFDFRKNRKEIEPVNINGVDIEIVTEYKYLGTYIDSHLNWNVNTQKLCSKANQRIYFLRKLKLFNIDRDIMMMFLPKCHTICYYVLLHCMGKWSVCG